MACPTEAPLANVLVKIFGLNWMLFVEILEIKKNKAALSILVFLWTLSVKVLGEIGVLL